MNGVLHQRHSYSLRLSCTDLPDESTRTQRAIITVLANDRIAIEWGKPDGNPTEMRCGPNLQKLWKDEQ
jgi:hypothetical protein